MILLRRRFKTGGNMKSEIKGRKICVEIWDIFANLSKDDKLDLIEHLSCEDEIIHRVADQLIHGYTNDGSCGGSYCDPSELTVLDKYKRLVAKSASERAKKEIENLEDKIKKIKKENSKLSKYLWRIFHQYKFRQKPSDIIKGKSISRW